MKKTTTLLLVCAYIAQAATAQWIGYTWEKVYPAANTNGNSFRGLTPGYYLTTSQTNGFPSSLYSFGGNECSGIPFAMSWQNLSSPAPTTPCINFYVVNSGFKPLSNTGADTLGGGSHPHQNGSLCLFAGRAGNTWEPRTFARYTGATASTALIEWATQLGDTIVFGTNNSIPLEVNNVAVGKIGMVRISDSAVFPLPQLVPYASAALPGVTARVNSCDVIGPDTLGFGTTVDRVGSPTGTIAQKAFLWNAKTNTIANMAVDNLSGTGVKGMLVYQNYIYFGYTNSDVLSMPAGHTAGLSARLKSAPAVPVPCGTGVGTGPVSLSFSNGNVIVSGTKKNMSAPNFNTNVAAFTPGAGGNPVTGTFQDLNANNSLFPNASNLGNTVYAVIPMPAECPTCPNGLVAIGTFPEGIKKFCLSGALPVKLRSFQLQQNQNSLLISWNMETVESGTVYEIEKSENGKDFTPFYTETGTLKQYFQTTTSVPSVQTYYRLKMVHPSGKYEYSSVLVYNPLLQGVVVGPNPVKSGGQLLITSRVPIRGIRITNTAGQVMYTTNVSGVSITTTLPHLPPGIYLVQVENSSGVVPSKIMIQ